MEQVTQHKGYSIKYSTFGGTTFVLYVGFIVKRFPMAGYIKGKKLAKEYMETLDT